MRKLLSRLVGYFADKKNWKKASFWIILFIGLRAVTIFCREYGLTLFKKNLKNEHVFLTGAGSGIGRLMALKLSKMGCKLSLSDINMAGLEETKLHLLANEVPLSNISITQCDVSKKDSVAAAAALARSTFGPVTLLINNAGIVSGKTTLDLQESMIRRTMDVNTISHLFTIKEFLPDMIAGKKGHIVSIASMAGLCGLPGLSDYCASKYGAVAIDEALRLELKKNGHYKYVKTTCICPYFIETGMFKGAKIAFPMYILTPEEVVTRIINAIQQEESTVVIPWRGNVLFLTRLLPVSVTDTIGKLLGVTRQMDDF
jgi:all-trans-retinol dehydrogenase (NAD+)